VFTVGDRVGDWVIEAPLGEGGMGAVYRVHAGLSERVQAALKVLKTASDAEARTRFVREAEALSALSHPAIVRVMGFGEDSARGVRYLAMELVLGETLKARLQRGTLSLPEALAAFAPLASALEHAHAAGIFHRDVKPANVVLCSDGTSKLVDFGIAIAPEWETLTLTGHVGTFAYLPPEVFRGEKTQPGAIDVYAFGQCIHEALTGQRPFGVEPGLTPAAVAAAVGVRKVQQGPLDIGDGFPQALREEVWKATDPDPAKRTTMRAMREVLEPLRELVVGPLPEAPAFTPPAGGDGPGADRTMRVPDPPKPAYTERPRSQWVQRKTFRGRRKGERFLILAAIVLLVVALLLLFVPRGRVATGDVPPAEGARRGDLWTNPRDGLEYAWIPAGHLRMGCTPNDPRCDPGRLPPKEVDFERGFWFGRTEVTVDAFKRFASATGSGLPHAPTFNTGWSKGDHPMANVPFESAVAYCTWAGTRLPTEAEWEYAARGGHADRIFPWGNEEPVCQSGAANGARFDDGAACHELGTEKVASYGANPYGLYDLSGNVWEWCQDVWKETDPTLEDAADGRPRRVLRGASRVNEGWYMRVSIRSRWFEGPASRDFIGFRCVKDA
jgi:formylglycine-generating enzyme required for sulfatase activity